MEDLKVLLENCENVINTYKLSRNAYKYYKKNVRGNENISFDLAVRKLNRNIYTGLLLGESGKRKIFAYGNLLIYIKGNKIKWLINHKGKCRFRIDKDKRNKFNEIFELA